MTCSPLQKHPNFGKNIDVIPLLNVRIKYFFKKENGDERLRDFI